MNRRSFLAGGLATVGAATLPADLTAGHLRGVTAYTQVYGDGQKLSHLLLTYDEELDGRRLSTTTFRVANRVVTGAWTAARPGIDAADRGPAGRHVVLELSLEDSAALLWVPLPRTGGGPPQAGDTAPSHQVVPASASVVQAEAVYTSRGARYAPDPTAVTSTAARNLIVDDFEQHTYLDEATGLLLPYNVYLPDGYDGHRTYPLVLFMHDAGVINAGPLAPLVQGVGATVWARDNASIVVAPAYPEIVVGDDYQPTGYFDATVNLVGELTRRYGVDPRRRHATGQSMGAMMSLGMNIRHPDLFASSYIVAGQWPAEQAAPLAGKKLWVCVSQGDTKAYPGMTAIVGEIEPLGATVTTATWNGAATPAEFRAAVAAMEAAHAGVNFASFTPGTLPGTASGGNEHTSTWQVAYDIPGIRRWILTH